MPELSESELPKSRIDAQLVSSRATGHLDFQVGSRKRTVDNYSDGDVADADDNKPKTPKIRRCRHRKDRYQLGDQKKEKRANKKTKRVADPAYNSTCRMPRLTVNAKEFPLLPIEGQLREMYSDERAPEVPEDYHY